jgi:hypothetical protein
MSGSIHPLPQYAFMAWCSVKNARILKLGTRCEWSGLPPGHFNPPPPMVSVSVVIMSYINTKIFMYVKLFLEIFTPFCYYEVK